MVTIVSYKKRMNEGGEAFYALIIQSGVELVKSKETGKFYATARKTSIPSTFDEEVCAGIIGTKLPGTIEKVASEPYEYTVESTGEVVTLNHTYRYNPQEHATMEEAVLGDSLV